MCTMSEVMFNIYVLKKIGNLALNDKKVAGAYIAMIIQLWKTLWLPTE